MKVVVDSYNESYEFWGARESRTIVDVDYSLESETRIVNISKNATKDFFVSAVEDYIDYIYDCDGITITDESIEDIAGSLFVAYFSDYEEDLSVSASAPVDAEDNSFTADVTVSFKTAENNLIFSCEINY